ncbi:hypothetical protein DFH06DRAFT_115317 [Mycena polygramma]|nr:hypothetical protein DFH06DRAFT_115317 [Mycena polygramma]
MTRSSERRTVSVVETPRPSKLEGNQSCGRGSARAGTAASGDGHDGGWWRRSEEKGDSIRSSYCDVAIATSSSSSSLSKTSGSSRRSQPLSAASRTRCHIRLKFGSSPIHLLPTSVPRSFHDVPGLAPSSMLPRASLSPKPLNAAHHDHGPTRRSTRSRHR